MEKDKFFALFLSLLRRTCPPGLHCGHDASARQSAAGNLGVEGKGEGEEEAEQQREAAAEEEREHGARKQRHEGQGGRTARDVHCPRERGREERRERRRRRRRKKEKRLTETRHLIDRSAFVPTSEALSFFSLFLSLVMMYICGARAMTTLTNDFG